MHRSRLPILQACDEDWARMPGTATTRRCAACDHEVIDLSAMTAEAAIDAVFARAGRACVRYRVDADGEIQFAPPRPRRAPAALALSLAACAGWVDEPIAAAPGELGACVPDPDDADACARDEAPAPIATQTYEPGPAVIEAAATREPAGPLAMPSGPPTEGEPGEPAGEATGYTVDLEAAADGEHYLLGMIIEVHDPHQSLFDRASDAPSVDWWTTLAALRARRALRREAREERRAERRRRRDAGR